jgi:hypothetical protein
MCKHRDAIAEQNEAARALTRACIARRTYVVLKTDLLRDASTIKCLPEPQQDFDAMLDEIDRKAAKPKG